MFNNTVQQHRLSAQHIKLNKLNHVQCLLIEAQNSIRSTKCAQKVDGDEEMLIGEKKDGTA